MLDVFKTLGLTGLVLTALVYIARQIVLHVFSRDLDVHKANLDRQLEQHAHDLRCLLQQFQIQYSKTYERQVDVIRQLYDGVRLIRKEIGGVEMRIRIPKLFDQSADPQKIEAAVAGVSSAHQALREFKEDNDIYLPASLSEQIEAYLKRTDISLGTPFWRRGSTTDAQVVDWERRWTDGKAETDRIASELKMQFRQLQGIDTVGQQDGCTVPTGARGRAPSVP